MLPIQWLMRALSMESSGRGMRLTTCLHLVPRLRTNGALLPLLYASLACGGKTLLSQTGTHSRHCSQDTHLVTLCIPLFGLLRTFDARPRTPPPLELQSLITSLRTKLSVRKTQFLQQIFFHFMLFNTLPPSCSYVLYSSFKRRQN